MKVNFQAKDIQEMLAIARQRYEYLANKIGITPEIAEVAGKGKAHLYSFRNALQFAFAHSMSSMGLSPRIIRSILNSLDHIRGIDRLPIYDPNQTLECQIRVVGYGEGKRVGIDGAAFSNTRWLDESDLNEEPEILISKLVSQEMGVGGGFAEPEAYVSFDLGLIKEKVQRYSKG
jgi:hypothetical protein